MELLQATGEPTKKPLNLRISPDFPSTTLNGVPLSSARDAFEQVKDLMNSELWQWDLFPIVLPEPTIASKDNSESSQIVWSNIFKDITYDEGPTLSGRSRGQVLSLNEKQLSQVRKTGEFDVPSQLFPGKNHRWILSGLLQKGKEKIWNSFLKGMASTIRPLIVMMPDLLWRGSFSVQKGIKHLYYGILYFPSLFVGYREVFEGQSNISKNRLQFIMQELTILKDSKGNEIPGLWKVQKKGETAVLERIDQEQDEELFDFRFLDDQYAEGIKTVLKDIHSQLDTKWKRIELQRRSELVWKLQKEREKSIQQQSGGKSLDDEAMELVFKEKKEELYQNILQSETLEEILPGVGKRLIQFSEVVSIFSEEEQTYLQEKSAHEKEFRERIRANHSIRGKVSEWVDNRVNDEMKRYQKENEHTILNRVSQRLKANKFHAEYYLLDRFITFEKDHREKLETEQKKQNLQPEREFEYSCRIWFARNWIITKSEQNPPTYSATKSTTHRVTSMYPFWRFGTFIFSTYSALKNMNHVLFHTMWNGKFSIKSLFLASPFYPEEMLNTRTGQIETNRSKVVETLISNLISLWNDIFQARENFERKPDTGFLGKSITRWFNRFWHYIVKGLFGTLVLLITRPLISLGTIAVCFLLMLASPLLAVLWGWLSNIPFGDILKWIWGFVGKGFGQTISALFLALFCPFISVAILLYTLLSAGSRSLYDFLLYHLIVKIHARVPSEDGFLARRISGPGLRSSYYFQVPTQVAVVALQSRLDSYLLNETEKYLRKRINEPVRVQKAVYNKYLGPYGCTMSPHSAHVSELSVRTQELNSLLSSSLRNFRKVYSGVQLIEIPYANQQQRARPRRSRATDVELSGYETLEEEVTLQIDRGQVFYPNQFPFPLRQTAEELKQTIQDATVIVKRFFTERYFPLSFYVSAQQVDVAESKESKMVDFWYYRNLEEGDWIGLTCQLLEEVFQAKFLVPIDDEEGEQFVLHIQSSSVSTFADQLLRSAPIPDPLDSIRIESILLTKKNNYNSNTLPSPAYTIFDERRSEALESLRIRMPKLPFKAESLTITPARSWDSNGIKITLKGRKSSQFFVFGVRLLLDGSEIWSSLEDLFGFAFVALARSFYPVDLTPFINNLSTFNTGSPGMGELVIEVGSQGKMLFKGTTLKKKLQQLIEHGDPKFTLRLEYGQSSGYFSSMGDLVAVNLSASSLLKALEGSTNLLTLE